MSKKQVFNINQKLFNQLNDWQEKMEEKQNTKAEREAKISQITKSKKSMMRIRKNSKEY
ncbi:MAG: hypothetical protein F6K25_02275 [Okeania sp. SIO2G4]|uniref:hypothetical protein n=1 Tax=unclassified Okeania TaxID=2634635 RepID=UPI0013B64367|nr:MULTISPECIES: hypothetical protein [unclassified Okeania]NEP08423.1 hypothetical protein [Okeania sp. SIO4D6]NEP70368.1 hypothetical protein [Okeania sp. SIO2G5]NEP91601.1 hypothetical protein [Okeania sp. SIO2F5]NEQ89632.1 hypothetical protein [Okeania sp. SIO2G4]